MRDPIAEFMNYNRAQARRNPELLRLKVAKMASGPFAFFRGTFHLFARDVLDKSWDWLPLMSGSGVEMDLVGDIHSENYGTYKAEDGKIHYDINDFDETTRGRFDLDVCRLAVSLYLAARERGTPWNEASLVPQVGLMTYVEAVRKMLKKGVEYDISEDSPSNCPSVDELVHVSAAAKRSDFINHLAPLKDGRRQIGRTLQYYNLPDDQRAQALRLLEDFVRRHPDLAKNDHYKMEDVCGRVAGVGSMGRLRYAVLVNGKGTKEGRNILVEFKESCPSAFDVFRQRETSPEALARRAEQVVTMQRLTQAAASPHLGFAVDGTMSFQVREVGPHDSRVDLKALKNTAHLDKIAQVHAAILARAHARSATRVVGVANPLAELNDPDSFCQNVQAFALIYADLVRRDWTRFVAQRAELENVDTWAK